MEPTVLRETKIGQKGFIKEDVLTYLDELNSKIEALETDLKNASEKGPSDPQEIIKYRSQIDNLQEKLNKSNQALREAKKENEELQKQVTALKSGNPAAAAAANPQAQAALEAAKKEIDSLRNQLKAAEQKTAAAPANAPANPQISAALEAAKKEIDNLRNQLKAADQKAAAAEQKAAASAKAAAVPAQAAPAADNSAVNAELAKTKEELAKASADVKAKTDELKKKSDELEAKIKESAEKDSKLAQLTKDAESAADKDKQIEELNKEVAQLKETASNPIALMGNLFAEAQKNVTQVKLQAQQEADQTTKEANEKADRVIREATLNAEKTTREADEKAEKVIKEANAAAEAAIKEANERAKATVDDANIKADKINEMSATVRNMLMNEIESVGSRFNDLASTLMKLNNQTADKLNESKLIVSEARKAVEPNENNTVKRAEAPKADFVAAKAPTATPEKKDQKPSDPFANVPGGSYNNGNANSFNNTASKPAQPVNETSKPAAKKSVSNFNFDMSDLLKAAEEEAAKESE